MILQACHKHLSTSVDRYDLFDVTSFDSMDNDRLLAPLTLGSFTHSISSVIMNIITSSSVRTVACHNDDFNNQCLQTKIVLLGLVIEGVLLELNSVSKVLL